MAAIIGLAISFASAARLTVDIRVIISAYRIEKIGDDHPYM
jgi:hypothetical protein